MTSPSRFLPGNLSAASPPSEALNIDSDLVVILAALLCALICVIGLVAVARCAWLRRFTTRGTPAGSIPAPPPAPANKGLKKKVLRSLPKQKFDGAVNDKLNDCAICLTEFSEGEEIRLLPQCGHAFHVACIDTWLGGHSSCPSCRKVLVFTRCQKCGGFPETGSSSDPGSGSDSGFVRNPSEMEAGLKAREDDVNRFLP